MLSIVMVLVHLVLFTTRHLLLMYSIMRDNIYNLQHRWEYYSYLCFVLNVSLLSFLLFQPLLAKSAVERDSIPYNNSIRIFGGYSEAFVNGFALDNPVKKTGSTFELSYFRNLTDIIYIGVAGGYSHTIDERNPTYGIRDEETIHYLHLKLLTQLVDYKRHGIFVGFGAGIVNTNRVLGTMHFEAGIWSRDISYSDYSSLGYSAELNYKYQISKSYSTGLGYSIITHNDGVWNLGVYLNYHF